MRKYICNACGIRICTAEYQSGSGRPFKCTAGATNSQWHEVKEEPATTNNQSPKLTVEVFDRPDCPEWANYAAVDADGTGVYYQNKPKKERKLWVLFGVVNYRYIGRFDASDWKNSLIERPAKALPDWCKVERYGFDNEQKRYFEIVYIDKKWVDIEYLDDGNGATCDYSDIQKCSEARKRPYNAEEMKALVGKVAECVNCLQFITAYYKEENKVYVDNGWRDAEYLLINDFTVDGKPCYVLEHKKKNGEWVK